MDLLSYLQRYEPDNLKHVARNVYCTREHDSLKISNGKWYWWSRGFGGVSALDYLIKVKEYSFVEAVEALAGITASWSPPPVSAPKEEPKVLLLPPRNKNCDRVTQYLFGRGIDFQIIQECIADGTIYESARYHNVVFIGKDESGTLSMQPIVVRWPAPLRAMHREVTSGTLFAFWQESLASRCICLKQPLIYSPMRPCSNVKVRTTKKKICFLFRVYISQRKR